jgi:hypothetical protein
MASGAETSGAKIPKLIHQIWIGSNPKPTSWMKTVEDFAHENGYEYKLWTEDMIDSLEWGSFFRLRTLYDNYQSYAGRSDILRYLILYMYGGIYIDADMVIVKPKQFLDLLQKNRAPLFFAHEKPKNIYKDIEKKHMPHPDDNLYEINSLSKNTMIANSVIGSIPKHPFMELACNKIIDYAEIEKNSPSYVRSGSMFLTRLYNLNKEKFYGIHFYPARFFYPIHWDGIKDPRAHHKLILPEESMMFQYGYSTNNFAEIFKNLEAQAKAAEQAQTGGDEKEQLPSPPSPPIVKKYSTRGGRLTRNRKRVCRSRRHKQR